MALLFGKIAIAKGYLTADQLQRILEIHGEESQRRPLGEIAVSLGFISEEMLSEVLLEQDKYQQENNNKKQEKGVPVGKLVIK